MDSFDEDGEIKDDVRHHPSRNHDEHDDDEFSMSSYDGEQTDSLVIKPPQAVVLHRDKKEKREKRDRHRHKGERHKDRHRNRERGSGHEERRREHRRHRERDGERREGKRHEKHRERGSNKHERPIGDLRNKLDKDRKLNEREQSRTLFLFTYHSRGTGSQMLHHRERRQEEPPALPSLMLLELSPHEKSEREKRMERFMLAEKQKEITLFCNTEKQKEITQREADVRRQRREEERREEKRMEELRQRAEESMLRNTGRSYSDQRIKRKKKHVREEPETVELISDDDEKESVEEEEVMEVEKDNAKYDRKKRKLEEEDEHSQNDESEVRGSTPKSASSDPTIVTHNSPERTSPPKSASHSDSSSSSSSDDDDDDEDDDDEDEDEDDATDEGEEVKTQASSDLPSSQAKKLRLDDQSHSGSSSGDTTDDEKKGDSDDEMIGVKKENFAEESPVASPPEIKEKLPPYYPAIMGCRSVDEFECLNRIEEGTYGVVYRAREKSTNEIVALKRLKMEKEKEGFPITSLREVNTLLKGQHDNIVTVREIVVGSNMDKIYIVMDYVEHDLKSLMETMRKKKQSFTIGEVKTLMIQLLRAVHHLHDNWILHRDLKTSNLLLSHRGIIEVGFVGDFGLAREYGSPLKQYTPIVVTLWYRAPELLLGTKEYSCPIDVWSVGCIFGELLGMEPMFPGKSEIDQLNKIFKDLGTPSDKIWPGYSQMPVIKKTQFAYYPYNHLKERFKTRLSAEGFSLLNSFLTYNPAKRITCAEGLKHDYFYNEEPSPIDPAMFPTWPAKSENPHGGRTKKGVSPKPPSGGKNFKALGDGEDESIAGFFLGGAPSSGPGFTLKF
ncbi:Cyclin-dependent kinase 11B [Armadillidium nasatum]|uniref:cyclin-dependent kinase n=1 Tax=Armadillidium nasatum TaxID=96803 RepID=A0A5N5T772_9CRUS|nr:Cyclin-dependent kinase 11B [Armadillidium nasatum]